MTVDMKEARRLAWAAAAFAAHVKDTMSIPDLERPKHEGLKIIANMLRDLCDEVEDLRNLKVEEAIQQTGGFFGPRSEMESHMAAEIEHLKDQYRNATGNEPEAY